MRTKAGDSNTDTHFFDLIAAGLFFANLKQTFEVAKEIVWQFYHELFFSAKKYSLRISFWAKIQTDSLPEFIPQFVETGKKTRNHYTKSKMIGN